MSGRRRFICPSGFYRAMRLCLRAFGAVKLVTSGASPIHSNVRRRFQCNATARRSLRQQSLNRFGASAEYTVVAVVDRKSSPLQCLWKGRTRASARMYRISSTKLRAETIERTQFFRVIAKTHHQARPEIVGLDPTYSAHRTTREQGDLAAGEFRSNVAEV